MGAARSLLHAAVRRQSLHNARPVRIAVMVCPMSSQLTRNIAPHAFFGSVTRQPMVALPAPFATTGSARADAECPRQAVPVRLRFQQRK